MRRSKAEVYLHLVWATHNRSALLTPALTPRVYACIIGVAERLGCAVLAIGGMPDHVHLVVTLSPRTNIAQLVQQVKGTSSKLASELAGDEVFFQWQEGYGVFSLSRPHVPKVIAYVENQPRHHANSTAWRDWEETSISVDPSLVREDDLIGARGVHSLANSDGVGL